MACGLSGRFRCKDGGPLLRRALEAVRSQGELELLVIDSGSRDGSLELARAAGRRGDRDRAGRVRPRAHAQPGRRAHVGGADLLPHPGRRARSPAGSPPTARRSRSTRAWAPPSGRTCPHPGTSPMIARELTEFFAGFSPNGSPVLHRTGDLTFLSNVNACYSRACWEEIRFADARLRRGPGLRPRDARGGLGQGVPAAAPPCSTRTTTGRSSSCGATSTSTAGCASRAATWSRSRAAPGARARCARTLAGCASRAGPRAAGRAGWRARPCTTAAAGWRPRSARAPSGCPAACSARSRSSGAAPREAAGRAGPAARAHRELRPAPPPTRRCCASPGRAPAPLDDPVPGMAERAAPRGRRDPSLPARQRRPQHDLHPARAARGMGHTCSLWLHDPRRRHHEGATRCCAGGSWRSSCRCGRRCTRASTAGTGPTWSLATGWDTVYPALLLPGCRARAYLVQDHEPEFFATSAESLWAERTYELGLYGIAGEPLAARPARASATGTTAGWFRFGVDHGVYRPRPSGAPPRHGHLLRPRRHAAARRAARAAGADELRRRRPDSRASCSSASRAARICTSFALRAARRRRAPRRWRWRYSEATVGLCLSLTNYSLIPQEMMACGLPCVDLAGGRARGGVRPRRRRSSSPRPTRWRSPTRSSGCSTTRTLWRRRSEAGLAFVRDAPRGARGPAGRGGLREALSEREDAARGTLSRRSARSRAAGRTGRARSEHHERGADRPSEAAAGADRRRGATPAP